MRVAILSDLHVEFEAFEPPPPILGADLVVLAGDIHNGVEALHWARRSFPGQAIVQVAGNHEFYGACWQTLLVEMRQAARRLDIHFLENESVVVDGVQFLGTTLWTDFELYTVPGRPLQLSAEAAKGLMHRRMVDYSLIRWLDAGEPTPRLLTPDDSAGIHRVSRAWLEDRLAIPNDGPTVVVTHHLPSWRSVAPAFLRVASNAAFASDLDGLFGPAALWIHGHTHHSFDYRAGTTRVIANPRGYPLHKSGKPGKPGKSGRPGRSGEYENPSFDAALLIDIDG